MERPGGKDLGCGCEDDKCSNMTGSLSIINEFKLMYEEKMRIIDGEGGGDCKKQAKLKLQQDWISDLTEQNEMLIRAVEDLELEATERVLALEQRLKKTSQNASQVMSGYKDISVNLEEKFQETEMVRGDLRRLLEFLRRGCENGFWSANGFEFYTITREDLEFDAKRLNHLLNGNRQGCDDKTLESLREKEGEIEDLRRKLEECSQVKCMQETEHLRQSMLDMRDALTAEVADKHDTIVSLKREVQLLEDQCRKADQQTHFKDDIIKELRKEIKQFKQEKGVSLVCSAVQTESPLKSKPAGCLIKKLNEKCNQLTLKFEEMIGNACDCQNLHNTIKETLRPKSRPNRIADCSFKDKKKFDQINSGKNPLEICATTQKFGEGVESCSSLKSVTVTVIEEEIQDIGFSSSGNLYQVCTKPKQHSCALNKIEEEEYEDFPCSCREAKKRKVVTEFGICKKNVSPCVKEEVKEPPVCSCGTKDVKTMNRGETNTCSCAKRQTETKEYSSCTNKDIKTTSRGEPNICSCAKSERKKESDVCCKSKEVRKLDEIETCAKMKIKESASACGSNATQETKTCSCAKSEMRKEPAVCSCGTKKLETKICSCGTREMKQKDCCCQTKERKRLEAEGCSCGRRKTNESEVQTKENRKTEFVCLCDRKETNICDPKKFSEETRTCPCSGRRGELDIASYIANSEKKAEACACSKPQMKNIDEPSCSCKEKRRMEEHERDVCSCRKERKRRETDDSPCRDNKHIAREEETCGRSEKKKRDFETSPCSTKEKRKRYHDDSQAKTNLLEEDEELLPCGCKQKKHVCRSRRIKEEIATRMRKLNEEQAEISVCSKPCKEATEGLLISNKRGETKIRCKVDERRKSPCRDRSLSPVCKREDEVCREDGVKAKSPCREKNLFPICKEEDHMARDTPVCKKYERTNVSCREEDVEERKSPSRDKSPICKKEADDHTPRSPCRDTPVCKTYEKANISCRDEDDEERRSPSRDKSPICKKDEDEVKIFRRGDDYDYESRNIGDRSDLGELDDRRFKMPRGSFEETRGDFGSSFKNFDRKLDDFSEMDGFPSNRSGRDKFSPDRSKRLDKFSEFDDFDDGRAKKSSMPRSSFEETRGDFAGSFKNFDRNLGDLSEMDEFPSNRSQRDKFSPDRSKRLNKSSEFDDLDDSRPKRSPMPRSSFNETQGDFDSFKTMNTNFDTKLDDFSLHRSKEMYDFSPKRSRKDKFSPEKSRRTDNLSPERSRFKSNDLEKNVIDWSRISDDSRDEASRLKTIEDEIVRNSEVGDASYFDHNNSFLSNGPVRGASPPSDLDRNLDKAIFFDSGRDSNQSQPGTYDTTNNILSPSFARHAKADTRGDTSSQISSNESLEDIVAKKTIITLSHDAPKPREVDEQFHKKNVQNLAVAGPSRISEEIENERYPNLNSGSKELSHDHGKLRLGEESLRYREHDARSKSREETLRSRDAAGRSKLGNETQTRDAVGRSRFGEERSRDLAGRSRFEAESLRSRDLAGRSRFGEESSRSREPASRSRFGEDSLRSRDFPGTSRFGEETHRTGGKSKMGEDYRYKSRGYKKTFGNKPGKGKPILFPDGDIEDDFKDLSHAASTPKIKTGRKINESAKRQNLANDIWRRRNEEARRTARQRSDDDSDDDSYRRKNACGPKNKYKEQNRFNLRKPSILVSGRYSGYDPNRLNVDGINSRWYSGGRSLNKRPSISGYYDADELADEEDRSVKFNTLAERTLGTISNPNFHDLGRDSQRSHPNSLEYFLKDKNADLYLRGTEEDKLIVGKFLNKSKSFVEGFKNMIFDDLHPKNRTLESDRVRIIRPSDFEEYRDKSRDNKFKKFKFKKFKKNKYGDYLSPHSFYFTGDEINFSKILDSVSAGRIEELLDSNESSSLIASFLNDIEKRLLDEEAEDEEVEDDEPKPKISPSKIPKYVGPNASTSSSRNNSTKSFSEKSNQTLTYSPKSCPNSRLTSPRRTSPRRAYTKTKAKTLPEIPTRRAKPPKGDNFIPNEKFQVSYNFEQDDASTNRVLLTSYVEESSSLPKKNACLQVFPKDISETSTTGHISPRTLQVSVYSSPKQTQTQEIARNISPGRDQCGTRQISKTAQVSDFSFLPKPTSPLSSQEECAIDLENSPPRPKSPLGSQEECFISPRKASPKCQQVYDYSSPKHSTPRRKSFLDSQEECSISPIKVSPRWQQASGYSSSKHSSPRRRLFLDSQEECSISKSQVFPRCKQVSDDSSPKHSSPRPKSPLGSQEECSVSPRKVTPRSKKVSDYSSPKHSSPRPKSPLGSLEECSVSPRKVSPRFKQVSDYSSPKHSSPRPKSLLGSQEECSSSPRKVSPRCKQVSDYSSHKHSSSRPKLPLGSQEECTVSPRKESPRCQQVSDYSSHKHSSSRPKSPLGSQEECLISPRNALPKCQQAQVSDCTSPKHLSHLSSEEECSISPRNASPKCEQVEVSDCTSPKHLSPLSSEEECSTSPRKVSPRFIDLNVVENVLAKLSPRKETNTLRLVPSPIHSPRNLLNDNQQPSTSKDFHSSAIISLRAQQPNHLEVYQELETIPHEDPSIKYQKLVASQCETRALTQTTNTDDSFFNLSSQIIGYCLMQDNDLEKSELIRGLVQRVVNEAVMARLQKEMHRIISDLFEKDKQIMDLHDLVSMALQRLVAVFNCLHGLESRAQEIKAECNQIPNVSELEEENEELKNAIQEATDKLDEFQRTIDVYVEENMKLQQETKEFLKKIEQLETENAMLSENCCNMQTKVQKVNYYEELSLQNENVIQTMQLELDDIRRENQNARNEICDLNCQLQQRQLPPMKDISVQCKDRVLQPVAQRRHHRKRRPSDDFGEDSDYDDLVDCTASCLVTPPGGGSPPLSPKRNLRDKSPKRLMIKDSSDTDSSDKMLVLRKTKSKSGSETQDTTDASLIDGIEERFEKSHIDNELLSAGTDSQKKTWKAAKKVGKRVVRTIIDEDDDEDVKKLKKKYKKVKNTCSKRRQRQKALRDRRDIFSDTSLSQMKALVATTVSSQEFEQPTWNQLQGAVDGLKDSVSRMMVKESEVKLANQRIAELEEQVQLISKKDELITVQNDTLNIVENELQAWRTMETEVEAARCCREKEIANLKETICTLGNNLKDEKDRCQNLQKAVDLYLNTIAVLEASENDLKREISEQRTIIGTLQEALVLAKQGLEESRVRSGHEFGMLIRVIDMLRDENLALEEDLFYNSQDVEISETRLLKYQTMFRELKDECAQLQKDVVALRDQKENQCMFVDELNYQLVGCKDELMRLYTILTQEQEIMEDESLKLTEHVGMLQLEIGKLSQQLNYTMQCADMEKQTKVSLEVTLAKKDCEIVCLRNELYVLGEKLKMSAKELSEANAKLVHLQQCKETNICKLEAMAQALANTKQEFEMLSAEYTATVNNLKNVQMELQCCRTCTVDELKQYKDMAANLKEKLMSSEGNQKCLERELTCVRSKLEKTIENEAKLLQEKILRDNDFSTYQIEHDRLLNVIANLEQRIALLNCESSKREQDIGQMKNEFNNQILTQREESCKLKNEINNLVQKQTNFKTENEKLQSQLSKLRMVVSQNDETNHIMARELEQCVTDLSGIQREKQFLIEKNNALTQEIRALQDACQSKTESVVTLEMELNDTKCIKETLCSESRNVIDNVKSWLHEQRKINVELDNKIKFKNSVIEKLNGKIATLENKVRSLQRPKQRSSPVVNTRLQSSSGCYWSLGSVESPPCSFNGSETDWETVAENESTPQVWLHRVESLTQELQKNSRYWESKMDEVDYVVSRDN